jgi:hypothetical protein
MECGVAQQRIRRGLACAINSQLLAELREEDGMNRTNGTYRTDI